VASGALVAVRAGFAAARGPLELHVGPRVLARACDHAAVWHAQTPAARGVSLVARIGHRQLAEPRLVRAVAEALERTSLAPARLRLVVSEQEVALAPARAECVLGRVADLGVRVEVDRFGAVGGCLALIAGLPLAGVGLHPSLVHGLAVRPAAEAAVTAIVAGVHALGALVVGDGVQCREQLVELASLGADHVQGPLLGPPAERLPALAAPLAGRPR